MRKHTKGGTVPRFFIAIFILGLSVNWARADGALAVGLPEGSPSNGFVYGLTVKMELDKAQSGAMDICKGINRENNKIPDRASRAQAACRIIKAFRDQCVAISMNGDQHTPSTGVGWSIARTSDGASNNAVNACNSMRKGRGPSCRAVSAYCDGEAK
jgi:Domain of unknown function (DUF4189)